MTDAVFHHARACSFCGNETLDYVAGPSACICGPCARRTVTVLDRLRRNREQAAREAEIERTGIPY